MTLATLRRRQLAAALIALSASLTAAPAAVAQEDPNQETTGAESGIASRRGNRPMKKKPVQAEPQVVQNFPEATRPAPDVRATAKGVDRLQAMMKLYDAKQSVEARAAAEAIVNDPKANAYERAFAAQIAGNLAYDAKDATAAIRFLQKALELNSLDNNGHYNVMLMLAQIQMQQLQYAEAVKTFDRFFAETKSTKPEYVVMRGNALYRLKQYPQAIAALKQAIDGNPNAKPEWQQLLMAAYAESGQGGEAKKQAEAAAAAKPGDFATQYNLAITYLQSRDFAKAATTLEAMRQKGQLTTEEHYGVLLSALFNAGRNKDVITVGNEGLKKGLLKPDYQTEVALAQAYYALDQVGPAIEAFRKAAPLSSNGETYLNLARLLWTNGKISEAKEAARQAQAKGVKNEADVKKILALPGK